MKIFSKGLPTGVSDTLKHDIQSILSMTNRPHAVMDTTGSVERLRHSILQWMQRRTPDALV